MAKTTVFSGTLELYSHGGEEFLYIPSIKSSDLLVYLAPYVINTYLDTNNYDFYLNNDSVLNGEIINEDSIEILSNNIEIYTFFNEKTGESYPHFVGDNIQVGSTITFEVEEKVQEKKVNKVVYDNNTLIDITDTTAVESDVAEGKTFYKADGSKGTGTANIIDISDTTAIGSDVRSGKVFYRSSGSRTKGSLAIKYKDVTGTFVANGSTMEASLVFTSIPNYGNLTKNNFSILEETLYFTGTLVPTSSAFKTTIKSYTSSTGTLIVAFSANALKDTSTVKVRCYYI